MRSATVLIHLSGSLSLLLLTFKEEIQCFFLICNLLSDETSNMHLSLGIILDRDAAAILFSWLIREQVE